MGQKAFFPLAVRFSKSTYSIFHFISLFSFTKVLLEDFNNKNTKKVFMPYLA